MKTLRKAFKNDTFSEYDMKPGRPSNKQAKKGNKGKVKDTKSDTDKDIKPGTDKDIKP